MLKHLFCNIFNMNVRNWQKIIVYAGLLLDIIGIGILIPVFPELIHYYHIQDYQVSLGITVYSLCAFLAAPVLGQYSDKHWRKRILFICVLGTALSRVMLFVHSFWAYLAARIINGITWGNFSILQAILTDNSKDATERKKNFGMLGALFGLGFVVWPLLGAVLMHYGGVEVVFWFGLLFSVVDLILIARKLKESNVNKVHDKKVQHNPLPVFVKYFRQKKFLWIFLSLMLIGIGTFSYQSILSILMQNRFGVPGVEIGYYLAWFWVLSVLNQAIIIPKFWIKRFHNKTLLKVISLGMIPCFFVMAIAPNWWIFVVAWLLIVPFMSLMQTVYNSEIIQHTIKTEVGEMTWLLWSIQSLNMFVWPLIGTFALLHNTSVFYIGLVMIIISFFVILEYIKVIKKIEAHDAPIEHSHA